MGLQQSILFWVPNCKICRFYLSCIFEWNNGMLLTCFQFSKGPLFANEVRFKKPFDSLIKLVGLIFYQWKSDYHFISVSYLKKNLAFEYSSFSKIDQTIDKKKWKIFVKLQMVPHYFRLQDEEYLAKCIMTAHFTQY